MKTKQIILAVAMLAGPAWGQKFGSYPANSAPADGDLLLAVDISDTTDDPTGSTKKQTYSGLRDWFYSSDDTVSWGSGTAASVVITGNVTGTDSTVTFGSASAAFSAAVTVGTALTLGSTSADGSLVIYDDDAGGDATVTIQALDATGASYVLTLPPDAGVSGQFLQTDGNGVMDWATPFANVVEDTTPQLGGNLDVNAKKLTGAIDLDSTGDVVLRLGDAGGANKVSILDSGDVEVASINSDGDFSVVSLTADSLALTDGAGVEVEGSADALANGTYQAFKVVSGRNAGTTISQWNMVYLNVADGEWWPADADASAAAGKAWGMAATAGTDGNPIDVIVSGIIRNDAWSWSAAAVDLYVSDTAGALTETAPATTGDVVKIVARTLSDDEIYLDVTPHFIISD